MNGNSEKLPLDYPVKEMLKIYAKRLMLFLAIVIGNLALLVYLISFSMWPIAFSLVTILAAVIIFRFLLRIGGRKKPRATVDIPVFRFLEELGKWCGEITEIALLLIAIGITVEILFGNAVPFFGGIITNLITLLDALGDIGFAGIGGLAVLSIIAYFFCMKYDTYR